MLVCVIYVVTMCSAVCVDAITLFVLLGIGTVYRRYADELFSCHKDFLKALHKIKHHERISQVFVFSEEMMQLASAQCMHYLHGYYEVYPPSQAQTPCPVRQGLLLAAILGMTLKVLI